MQWEIKLFNNDCIDVLKTLDENSINSLVTDPPAGISFMGKSWDSGNDFIQRMTLIYKECLRVLKPGAHGLVWAIPRTSHWTATALENAGFEVRDVITHLFGSGFPKSLDVSKAIYKMYGELRITNYNPNYKNNNYGKGMGGGEWNAKTEPAKTDAAKQWSGYGTALKPAVEFWILVRKPLSEKTVAKNVLKHGCGGINIDACRIFVAKDEPNKRNNSSKSTNAMFGSEMIRDATLTTGRFPSNLVLSHNEDCENECSDGCAVKMLDEQVGMTQTGGRNASRFFYCSKVSPSERNAGLDDLPNIDSAIKYGLGSIEGNPRKPTKCTAIAKVKNNHPTVKPQKLMKYLITLITPPNGTVLDPFMGSGSTGLAAKSLGFSFIGIEREKEYFEIAEKRVNSVNQLQLEVK